LSIRPRGSGGHSKLASLIAGALALLGLGVAASAALGGGYWDGGSRLDCAPTDSCVYDVPVTNITGGPPAFTNDSTPSFSFDSDQETAAFSCNVDDVRTPKCESGAPIGPLDDGTYTFNVRARSNGHAPDKIGASRTFTVDTVKPSTTITSGPSGFVNDSPSFGFKSTEPGTFQCKVDGAAFAPCTSAKTLTGLSDGAHTFYVRAIDRAHNVDMTPASRAFTLDTHAPDTRLTAGPSGLINDRTPAFAFSSTEVGSTFQCKVDGGAFGSCSSPRTTSSLADGSHTFAVRAVDRAGNVDASPASRSFTVDATPPNTTITGGPSGTTTDATPTFTFKSSESGGSFQCKVDSGPLASCSSPRTTASLGNGGHTFSVRAVDGAGNPDLSPATRSFTVKRR
jgi:hypothetical protein